MGIVIKLHYVRRKYYLIPRWYRRIIICRKYDDSANLRIPEKYRLIILEWQHYQTE